MKNSIVIMASTLAFVVLTAFAFTQTENSKAPTCKKEISSQQASLPSLIYDLGKQKYTNFFYDVGPRFYTTVTKEQLRKATTIYDFLSSAETAAVIEYKNVKLVKLKQNGRQTEVVAKGEKPVLTAEQVALLKGLDYSNNFLVYANITKNNTYNGEPESNYFSPHITVVPEKQAAYLPGKMAFLDYFKSNNKENTFNLDQKKLKAAKLHFTISRNGTITNIYYDGTCGYENIDKEMMDLLKKLPGSWTPAENEQGEKVEQELVLSYGIIGC